MSGKFLLYFFLTIFTLSSAQFSCNFTNFKTWGHEIPFYYCIVTTFPEISSPNTKVTTPTGSHSQTVEGFNYELTKKIQFFPHGLDESFPSLKLIKIKSAGLREIHQNDLKNFQDLEILNFFDNEIGTIEENLFEFNRKLRAISFEKNKIFYVEIQAFKSLPNLRNFYIGDVCIKDGSANSKTSLEKLLKILELSCSNHTMKILEEIREIKKIQNNFENSLSELRSSMNTKADENDSRSDFMTKNISIFIAIPLVCLATVLNVGLVILCLRERISCRFERKNDEIILKEVTENEPTYEVIDYMRRNQ